MPRGVQLDFSHTPLHGQLHTIVPAWSQKTCVCRGISHLMTRTENTSRQPCRHPSRPAGPTCTATPTPRSSRASGVQRAVGLPECATPPEEVYELAKRRGMDFVTITDHDTIDGVLQIAERPDVFISEELTAELPRRAAGRSRALLRDQRPTTTSGCRRTARDVELCAAYMYEREIACALAHPYYTVAAPLTARHRRRLAELFAVWEVRNGARAPELNRPAAIYVATRDGIGIGGSDDHAGVDIGRTWTETPAGGRSRARSSSAVRAGEAIARGAQGSAAKWAHAAIALAIRTLGVATAASAAEPDPRRVLSMAARLLREGDVREGAPPARSTPGDARCLLSAWLAARRPRRPRRRAADRPHAGRRLQPRRPVPARLPRARAAPARRPSSMARRCGPRRARRRERGRAGCSTPASPRSPTRPRRPSWPTSRPSCARSRPRAAASARPARARTTHPRVAILADGIGSTHGVTRTIEEIRQRGVPGFEIEVAGHRRRGRPPARRRGRDRRALLPRAAHRRAEPAGRRAGACGRLLRRRPRLLARAGRDRRCAGRARARAAPARQLPHRAGRLRRACAQRPGATRRGDGRRRGAVLQRLRARALAERGLRPGAGCDRHPRRARDALGPRRRHRRASTRRCARRRADDGADRRALLGPDHPREGRRAARRGVPARPAAATRACTWCSPAAAPSRSGSPSASASDATFLGWLEGGELARPTRTPTCSCSRARPTPSAR